MHYGEYSHSLDANYHKTNHFYYTYYVTCSTTTRWILDLGLVTKKKNLQTIETTTVTENNQQPPAAASLRPINLLQPHHNERTQPIIHRWGGRHQIHDTQTLSEFETNRFGSTRHCLVSEKKKINAYSIYSVMEGPKTRSITFFHALETELES